MSEEDKVRTPSGVGVDDDTLTRDRKPEFLQYRKQRVNPTTTAEGFKTGNNLSTIAGLRALLPGVITGALTCVAVKWWFDYDALYTLLYGVGGMTVARGLTSYTILRIQDKTSVWSLYLIYALFLTSQ